MISYEVSIGLKIISVVLCVGLLNLTEMASFDVLRAWLLYMDSILHWYTKFNVRVVTGMYTWSLMSVFIEQ